MFKNLILLPILCFACTTNSNQQAQPESSEINEFKNTELQELKNENQTSAFSRNVSLEKIEVLDTDSVWLNDAIGFSVTQKEILDKLGEPDSITTPRFECGGYIEGEEPWGDTVNIWHYQGTQIVTYKDRAELMFIKLRDWDCTLHHYRFIFSEHTTLEELAEEFPVSVKNSYDHKDSRDGITYRMVQIAPKSIADDRWFLRFLDNKLVDIKYWIGC